MPKPRKTILLSEVVPPLNRALAAPDMPARVLAGMTPDQAYRAGLASALESIICAANAYAGYGFLPSELDASGSLIEGHDSTRRVYSFKGA